MIKKYELSIKYIKLNNNKKVTHLKKKKIYTHIYEGVQGDIIFDIRVKKFKNGRYQ